MSAQYYRIRKKVYEKFSHNSEDLKRFNHMEEVVKMALYLKDMYGDKFDIDYEKIKIAGILHDYTKNMSFEEATKYLEKYLTFDELEEAKKAPSVIHSITAYYLVQEELGINDEEILKAILYHTTGNPNMSKLEELIFVADAVELTRTYEGVEEIRKRVYEDFYKGMLYMIEQTLKHLKEKGWYINPKTIETYEYYKNMIENKKQGEKNGIY